MATIGTLAVNVVARTDKFIRGMTKSQGMVAKFTKTTLAAGKALATLGAGAIAAGGAIGTYLVKQQFDAVDSLAKTADKLGISTEKLASYHLAAEESGAGIETLNTGLEKMVIRISEAAQGTGMAVGALSELNLSAAALNRLSPDRQFEAIADAIAKVERQSDRVRLSYELFGRSGTALVNTLKLGRDGLAEIEQFATKAGLTVNRDMAAAVERANDAWGRMRKAVVGLARQIAVRVAPIVEGFSKRVTEVLTDDGRVRTFAETIARAIGGVIAGAIKAVHRLRIAMADARRLFLQMTLDFANSPLASAAGIDISVADAGALGRGINAAFNEGRALRGQDPGGDFLKWFNKHLEDALKQTPETPKPISMLVEKAQAGLAPIAGMADSVLGKLRGAGGGAMAAFKRFADDVAGGPGATPRSSPIGGLALARAGSAESYQLRRRIERQRDSLPKLAKDQLNEQREQKALLGKIVEKLGDQLAPANLFGA